ncbi:LamG-like jellyroll fold domain-containing protein, partial [Kitasatospora indigofera]|uniref:LamG-like jellyroll fold domain-containing protein n=1 Tax=Kitasatospora indigofera TaxID=67307 RepID=UPI00364BA7D8
LGHWYHLVGVHDAAAGTISLYVDGTLAATVPGPAGDRSPPPPLPRPAARPPPPPRGPPPPLLAQPPPRGRWTPRRGAGPPAYGPDAERAGTVDGRSRPVLTPRCRA